MPRAKRPMNIPQASIIVAIIGLVGSIVATVISTTAKSQSEITQNKQTQFEQRFANLKGVDIQSGTCKGSYMEREWTLGEPGANDNGIARPLKDRTWTTHVVFAHAFSAQPVVLTGIGSLDSSAKSNSTRVAIYVSNITLTGFDVTFHTWNESKVYAVVAYWMAYQQ